MWKKSYKRPKDDDMPKKNVRYKIKDKSKLYEILTVKHGWRPVELIKYLKNGKVVLRLLFTNQIIVRKFDKRMRPYQKGK